MRFNFFSISFTAIFVSVFFLSGNSFSLTVKEERELGKEVLAQVERSYPIVPDPFIEKYINDLGKKIVKNSDNVLFDFQFKVIKDKTYNAFAVPGGYIFVHTGLIAAMENEAELAGILGHEIGHVNCRHIAQQVEDSKKISAGALAGLAAGIVIGMSGGDPDAVMGLIAGTQAAGQSAMLSYSRDHEREADNKGLVYVVSAGYSPEGLLNILTKIRSKEYWTETEAPVYLRTHPGTKERIENITAFINDHKDLPKLVEGSKFSDFKKVKTKVIAYYQDKSFALKEFENMENDLEERPLSYYGLALFWMRERDYEKSAEYFSKALKYNALDTELLFDYGKALFLKGDYNGAVLKFNAIKNHGVEFPEIDEMLGRSYIQLEEYFKARELLEDLIRRTPDIRSARYYLGIAYEKTGLEGKAHLSLARFYDMSGKRDVSEFHYKKAVSLLEGDEKLEAEKQFKEFKDKADKKKKDKKKEAEDKKSFRRLNRNLNFVEM